METRSLLALLLVPLAFAGCTETSQTDAATDPDLPTNATVEPKLFELDGSITTGVGAGGQYVNPTVLIDTSRFLEFTVPKNVTGTMLELRWADARSDLDVIIRDSDGAFAASVTGGSHGAGDTPVRAILSPEDLPEGSYRAGVWAKNAVAVDFELRVTVFESEIPEEYSAF